MVMKEAGGFEQACSLPASELLELIGDKLKAQTLEAFFRQRQEYITILAAGGNADEPKYPAWVEADQEEDESEANSFADVGDYFRRLR